MFTHLHVHTPYSFLDGASKIDRIVARAKELGMSSMAITDHNNLSAAVRFVKTAGAFGIKPIIGCELTLENDHHLTVLCRNKEGYGNLCAILTEAHMKNPRGSPKTQMETLRVHKEGLIALTGCRRGLVPSLILQKRFDEAQKSIEIYESIFGKEWLFVELSETLLPGSGGLNKALSELAHVRRLGLVATNNVHYLSKDDFPVHDVLTCVRTLTKLDEVHPERRLNAENYFKSPGEMMAEFKDYPDALQMTLEIAGKCQVPLELGKPNFPKFMPPSGFASSKQFLKHLVFQGAHRRYAKVDGTVRDRLEHELGIIEKLGYEDYFLVVWDLVEFAQKRGIRHAGRGSAADSAVAYCLQITDVDPVAHNLLFERFLSVERGEKPDIDVDFDSRRRDEVTAYVYEKYGKDHVASVATYNTFQGRSAIRDLGKAIGYSTEQLDLIAKRLPYLPASGITQAFEKVPELKALGISPGKLKTLLDVAEKVTDLPRFLSTHLGGVVISNDSITCLGPVQLAAKGVPILQFDKDDVEDLGLVKIDLLSLRTLGAVEDCLSYLGDSSPVDYEAIPFNDPDTFESLRRGDTVGVFQLESSAQRALQARLGADNIEDIVASVALIRPGPIKGNMVEPFIKRRHGLEDVVYLEPRLEPILKKTYGVILFQEQVIEIASVIANFSPGEADRLRRVMTHQRSGEEMEKLGHLFIEKAAETGASRETALRIFESIKGYASYGFCEAHARAFGTTAYKTAYLVQHYPAQFFAGILNNQPMGFYPASTVSLEAKRHGVSVRGVSVNRSEKDVTVVNGEIVLPFKMVKGMSDKAIEAILSERKSGAFSSLEDFVRRVRVDSDILRSLILCGAFDDLGFSRKYLLWELPHVLSGEQEVQSERLLQGNSAPGSGPGSVPGWVTAGEFSLAEKVRFEYEVLGLGVSAHPMELCRQSLRERDFVGSADLSRVPPGEFVKVGGIPVRPHRPPTRSGKTVVFLSLEDENGLVDVTCFENVYKKYGKFLFPGEIIPLGIWGQVQKRGNAFSVNARTVFPLSYVTSPSTN